MFSRFQMPRLVGSLMWQHARQGHQAREYKCIARLAIGG